MMDSYFVSHADDVYRKGYYSDFQLKWLQGTLAACSKDPSVKNVFVLSHQPAFDASGAKGLLYSNYDKDRKPAAAGARSSWIMWALMDTYGVDAFFCGHSHFYHRWNIVGDAFEHSWKTSWAALPPEFDTSGIRGKASWETTIPQVLNGTCGVPPDLMASLVTVPAEARSTEYNFSIVYVKGDTITVEVYAYTVAGGKATHWLIDKFEKRDGQWSNLPLSAGPA